MSGMIKLNNRRMINDVSWKVALIPKKYKNLQITSHTNSERTLEKNNPNPAHPIIKQTKPYGSVFVKIPRIINAGGVRASNAKTKYRRKSDIYKASYYFCEDYSRAKYIVELP